MKIEVNRKVLPIKVKIGDKGFDLTDTEARELARQLLCLLNPPVYMPPVFGNGVTVTVPNNPVLITHGMAS
jgi:hypothetical protein